MFEVKKLCLTVKSIIIKKYVNNLIQNGLGYLRIFY